VSASHIFNFDMRWR